MDDKGIVHFTNVPTDGKFKLVLKEAEPVFPEKEPVLTEKEKRVQFQLGPTFEKYDLAILKAAEKYQVDYALIKALIKAESNFNSLAISKMGARGLMQLMPRTAYVFQVNNSFHPEDNIEGGVRYLRYLINLFQGNMYSALAAYNAGEKAVFQYNGVPPYRETRTFVQRVLRYFQHYNREPRPDFSVQSHY